MVRVSRGVIERNFQRLLKISFSKLFPRIAFWQRRFPLLLLFKSPFCHLLLLSNNKDTVNMT